MRIPRSGELEWVEARLAGSEPKGARVGRSRRDECVPRGSAGASAGEGKRRQGKAGRWANQGAAASGCRVLMLPAPGF